MQNSPQIESITRYRAPAHAVQSVDAAHISSLDTFIRRPGACDVLVGTLWHSLAYISNISLLLYILHVGFGVIGVQLFAAAVGLNRTDHIIIPRYTHTFEKAHRCVVIFERMYTRFFN